MTKTEALKILKLSSRPEAFKFDEQAVKLLKGWRVVADDNSLRFAEPPLFWNESNSAWNSEYGDRYEYEFDTYVVKDGINFDKEKIGSKIGCFAQYYIDSYTGQLRLKEACLQNCNTVAALIMDNLDCEEKILERKSFKVSKK